MGVVGWIALVVGALLLFLLAQMIYFAVVVSWTNEQTNGLGYYGRSPQERARFKATLRRHARLLYPIMRLITRMSKFNFERASFRQDGIAGPRGTCSPESFQRGIAYRAQPEDVFVVTQMKCGTTWMQHVVYEVLLRGHGDIVDSGRTMYALSPWLEALKSVPVEQASLIGSERPTRIIKTHLPARVCPFSREARYIYVARHPVSCFASCVDFVATNLGAMAPPVEVVDEWFRSDLMWWGKWTDHVSGWWDRAQSERNVLFVHFETMKRDLPGVVRQVAEFLGVAPLSQQELDQVVEKSGFAYMQRHKDSFEMNPPHVLQTDAELFVRGSADRHHDVPADVKRRILEWCDTELAGSNFPLAETYPDVRAARTRVAPA